MREGEGDWMGGEGRKREGSEGERGGKGRGWGSPAVRKSAPSRRCPPPVPHGAGATGHNKGANFIYDSLNCTRILAFVVYASC